MSENGPETHLLRVTDMNPRKVHRFSICPDAAARAALADAFGISAIRKLIFSGTVTADGKRDWKLSANLGATVVQPCIVTLDPVTTRIDTPLMRRFLADGPQTPQTSETEMPDDDTSEVLGDVIDLDAIMAESLALALPDYPRSRDAASQQGEFAPPGAEPLRDQDVRPFAGLAGLRDKLAKNDEAD